MGIRMKWRERRSREREKVIGRRERDCGMKRSSEMRRRARKKICKMMEEAGVRFGSCKPMGGG
jgi:hypothetical protein